MKRLLSVLSVPIVATLCLVMIVISFTSMPVLGIPILIVCVSGMFKWMRPEFIELSLWIDSDLPLMTWLTATRVENDLGKPMTLREQWKQFDKHVVDIYSNLGGSLSPEEEEILDKVFHK